MHDFKKIEYPEQTVVFQIPEWLCDNCRHYYCSEKNTEGVFKVKYYWKSLVFKSNFSWKGQEKIYSVFYLVDVGQKTPILAKINIF